MTTAVLCVGICGATCSGKTTLAKQLRDQFLHSILINQDDFYLDQALLCECSDGVFNWDVPESLNQEALLHAVHDACNRPHTICQQCASQPCSKVETSVDGASAAKYHIILIEGTMILALPKLRNYLDTSFFLTLDENTCRQRRQERHYEGLPDPPGYFETFVWPSYLQLRDTLCVQTSHTAVLDGCQSLHNLRGLMVTHITRLAQKRCMTFEP